MRNGDIRQELKVAELREDTRMQTEMVWTCEENERERVC